MIDISRYIQIYPWPNDRPLALFQVLGTSGEVSESLTLGVHCADEPQMLHDVSVRNVLAFLEYVM